MESKIEALFTSLRNQGKLTVLSDEETQAITEQQVNKRNNRYIVYDGQKMTISQASQLSGIPSATLYSRYATGEVKERVRQKAKIRHASKVEKRKS